MAFVYFHTVKPTIDTTLRIREISWDILRVEVENDNFVLNSVGLGANSVVGQSLPQPTAGCISVGSGAGRL